MFSGWRNYKILAALPGLLTSAGIVVTMLSVTAVRKGSSVYLDPVTSRIKEGDSSIDIQVNKSPLWEFVESYGKT